MKEKMKNLKERVSMAAAIMVVNSVNALATTADAPWVGMMDKVMKILVGPTARILAILAIVGVGFMFMFGNSEAGSKKGMNVLLGISIIFAAATWGPKFFGYSGAILM